ncbi:MAG TPA: hypothetical protein VN959_13580 [Mycobacterium sp.]|nr:hypothetical protein [Mycobacterium sp.]
MGLRAGGLLRRAGAVSIIAAGISLFTIGMLPVQAAARHVKSAPTAPGCAHQPNLNDPTNSTNKALDSYWFAIQHLGVTTTVCTLFGNVSSGDIVTAHFTLASPSAADEVTLVSNTASSSSSQQTLFDCASFSVGADPDATGDPCLAATSQALTVHVPDCGFQVDLIYGEPLATMTIGQYRTDHRWVDGQVGNRSAGCTPTPTPTPTPTATPTATPTSGVGGATATPTPVGGVQGITTPGTGSGGMTLPLVGLVLILGGTAAVVRAWRRHPTPPTP